MKKLSIAAGVAVVSAAVLSSYADDTKRLYQNGNAWDWTGEKWFEHVPQDDGSVKTNAVKWSSDAIAVFSPAKNFGFSTDVTCQGIEWDSRSAYLQNTKSGITLNIGAAGFTFLGSGTLQGWMNSGATVKLAESQTWQSVTGKKGSANIGYTNGSLAFSGVPNLTSADDVTWTLNNIDVYVRAISELTSCDVVVQSGATLYIGQNDKFEGSCLNARLLTVDGGTVYAYRTWATEGRRNVAKALKIANGGICNYIAPGRYDVDSVEITAGEVNLNYVLALSQKVPLIVDSGATLNISTAPLSGGFTSLSGSGTVALNCDAAVLGDITSFVGKIQVSKGVVKLPGMDEWADDLTVETSGSGMVYVMSENDFDPSRITGTGRYVNCERSRTTLTRSGGGGGRWNEGYWTDGTKTGLAWQPDEIATMSGYLNLGFSPETFVYKFCRNYGGFWGNNTAATVFYLGAGGMEFSNGVGLDGWIGESNTIDLTASQVWTTVDGATSSSTVHLGSNEYKGRGTGKMTSASGITWTIDGKLSVYYDIHGDLANSNVKLYDPAVLNIANKSAFDGYLNCKKLSVYDGATVSCYVSQALPSGVRSIARELYFNDGGTLKFDRGSPLDFDSLEIEDGSLTASGSASLAESGTCEVSIESGATFVLGCTLANAAERPGALKFISQGGTLRLAAASESQTYVIDSSSIDAFAGTIEVADGATLAFSGALDLTPLEFLGNATVMLNLDRGDRITDWEDVVFPPDGKKITFKCYRADGIRQGEGTLDLGMDFSAVSAADRAKIAIEVDDKLVNTPLSMTATPSFVGDSLRLTAVLSSSMSSENNQCGNLVWVGRDFADMTATANWVIYPSGTTAANYNPDNHPADEDAIVNTLKTSGLYSSASWHLDLMGRSWAIKDGRANHASGALAYSISNGTFKVNSFMVSQGRFDVEYGAFLDVTAFSSSATYPAYFTYSGYSVASPFVYEIHPGATARIGNPAGCTYTPFGNVLFQVDNDASLTYRPWRISLANGGDGKASATTFANNGTLSFPKGVALTNLNTAVENNSVVRQNEGSLHLSGDFILTLGDGCSGSSAIEFVGGTTVLSNDVSFSGWTLRAVAHSDFALEIPEGGDFATTDFDWNTDAALEKKGAGILRVSVDNEVDSLAFKLTEGTLVATDTANAASLGVDFAGGALGVDETGTEYGLCMTNGSLSGTCRLRSVASSGTLPNDIAFLTVPAESDPGYTSSNVEFLRKDGKSCTGIITKENVTVGEVECVRYRATFTNPGLMILVK